MIRKWPILLTMGVFLLAGQTAMGTETPSDSRVRVVIGANGQSTPVPDSLKLDLDRPRVDQDDEAANSSGRSDQAGTGPALKAVIDLGQQRAMIYVNGEHEYTWKVSTARWGYSTPNGTFRPQWLARMHFSKKYDDAPMPFSVFFHSGYAIHGTEAIGRLGRPASHGCIRLHPDNAETLFNLVKQHGKANSRIVIVGSPNHDAASRWAAREDSGPGRRVVERFSFWGSEPETRRDSSGHAQRFQRPFSLDTYDL